MRHTITNLILAWITIAQVSAQIPEQFNGEYHALLKLRYTDVAVFEEKLTEILKVSDSLMRIQYNKHPNEGFPAQFSSLEECLAMNHVLSRAALNPSFIEGIREKTNNIKLVFEDGYIKIYKDSNNPWFLNRKRFIYDNRTTYDKVLRKHVHKTYELKNAPNFQISIDSTKTRTIAGIRCVKAIATYDDIYFSDLSEIETYKDAKVVLEMYVTDKIQTKYHPLLKVQNVLQRFYPMYLKTYRTALKETYWEFEITKIGVGNNYDKQSFTASFEQRKDSLRRLSVGKYTIDKIMEKGFGGIFQYIRKQKVPVATQLQIFKELNFSVPKPKDHNLFIETVGKEFWVYEEGKTMKDQIEDLPYEFLYVVLCSSFPTFKQQGLISQTNKCVHTALDALGNVEYLSFMSRMGRISNGELIFTDIKLSLRNNIEWLSFKVNGEAKEWKLAKKNYIADSFISRFVYLTEEFKTNGKYTYFDTGGEDFVIGYATPEKRKEFMNKTKLKIEWLTPGKHFSIPK